MAWLDVVDTILDPDFIDTAALTYSRNVQTVGADGLAVNTPTTTGFAGVVTNNNGDILRRRADGEHVEASIVIHTVVRLTAGQAPNVSADLVNWQGADYTVSIVNGYSHFGRGFVAVQCDLIPMAGST